MLLSSCSQESNSFLSRTFHNLTARDNAYFLGRERMKELENELENKQKHDYNNVLYPMVTIDTNETKAYKEKTDDIITKASFPIYKHKNSNYVEKSYLLVGKSRILRGEWKLAADTYRYVINDGKIEEDKHQGLIQLEQFFILKKDYRSAGIVAEHLLRKNLSPINQKDFFLTQAQYYRKLEQYQQTRQYLEKAIPLMRGKKERKAKMYFIVAQIYQLQGNDSSAYENYRKVLKNNPSYELFFYTKLYMNQVASTGSSKEQKKIDKYFLKLLKDKKNEEYKDKIYYEMALFEYKKKRIDEALTHLDLSVQSNKGNNFQKGASYLKSAQIYYSDKKNYELAKLYYDSTVSVWDKSNKDFPEINERQKILEEFVRSLKTIKHEDSLQRIAQYDSIKLRVHIDTVVAREKSLAALKAKREEAKKKAQEQKNTPTGSPVITNSNWYFDNATAVARGATDFKKKWGNRVLEPNWRRSNKETEFINDSTNTTSESKDSVVATTEKQIDYAAYMKDIPRTEEQWLASHNRIQEAMLQVGKIYKLKLDEPENSIEMLESLLKRYPQNPKNPEVLYTLYLLYKEKSDVEKAEHYKNRLITEYPKSEFARFLLNPNYREEDKKLQKEIALHYEKGFTLYQQRYYKEADSLLANLQREYPSCDINDKIHLLRILITGETKNTLIYKDQLEAFIAEKAYANRPTIPKAKELLKSAQEHLASLENMGAKISAHDVRYSTNTSKPHLVVLMLGTDVLQQRKTIKSLEDHIRKNYAGIGLQVKAEAISDSTTAITVQLFEAMYPSKMFYESLFRAGIMQSIQDSFYITDENYRKFKNDGRVRTYQNFFRENY
ncbi:MAG: tetratricopeptide repeat protein [Cytophagaceae bacterium]|jgi:tetratricopeptide (TPR) repeat protein|nr:tetratricopeptide repeat protein [Cytophagaceae bacterium]